MISLAAFSALSNFPYTDNIGPEKHVRHTSPIFLSVWSYVLKPFTVGDYIIVTQENIEGTVKEIQIF